MNGFNLSDIIDANLGGTFLSAIYLGSTKLWPTVIDYSQEYLTIKSLADNNTIRFKKEAVVEPSEAKTIYWSSDKTTWHSVSSDSGTIKTLSNNEKIYIKGNNNYYSSNEWGWNCFKSDYEFNISGNIMSLIYGDNFIGQTTLPSASYNFSYIFTYSKVVDASNLILPATTLTNGCYEGMFDGCKSLTVAPELPATTLADYCYAGMFSACTSLTTTPELPATTLADYCYDSMFSACTSLTTTPELPATTLANYCYQSMFQKCTSLSYIKMLATDISATGCLYDWVYNVASTGTFVKEYNLKSIPINSASGIPVGWTIEELNVDYSQEYFTIESLEDNNEIQFIKGSNAPTKTIEWSTDGTTWTSSTSSTTPTVVTTLNTGDKMMIRGNNTQYASGANGVYTNKLISTKTINMYGNIMSLLYGDNFVGQTTLPAKYTFCRLFSGGKMVDTSNLILPATNTTESCYRSLLDNNTTLIYTPKILPALTLTKECYANMFNKAYNIITSPILPALTLTQECYGGLFYNCSKLDNITCLATNISAYRCTNQWVYKIKATGTFTKNSSMTSWTRDQYGIPSGWTVIDA